MNDVNKQLLDAAKALADEAFQNMVGGKGHLIDDVYDAIAAAKQAESAAPAVKESLTADRQAVPDGVARAIEAVAAAIYFADSSDYLSTLWDTLRFLSPEIAAIAESDTRAAWERAEQARAMLAAAPQATAEDSSVVRNAVAVPTIKLGLYGRAFDTPQTRRAYTYQHQPDNLDAGKLGRAAASTSPGGDSIDHGLSLLKELQAHGFGVFELGDQQEGGAA